MQSKKFKNLTKIYSEDINNFMKIIRKKKVEGCLEGTNVWDIFLDDIISIELIKYLGQLGKLIYAASFEIPYFKIIVRSRFTIRGSLGNKHFRLFFASPDDEISFTQELSEFINNFI